MLGDVFQAGSSTFELSANQITDLENRNPALGQTISDAINYGTIDLSQGYAFTDSVYGTVLISTDAKGLLHVIGNAPSSVAAVNAPPYTSPAPAGLDLGSMIGNLVSGLESYAGLAVGAVVVYLIFEATRKK